MKFLTRYLVFLIFFIDAHANIHMGIVSNSGYCGERELAWRIKIAAESLGWKVYLDERKGRNLKKIKDLDFVLCLLPYNRHLKPNCPNYLTIFHPFNYIDKEGNLESFYDQYDGYLLTIKQNESITNSLKKKKKEQVCISFYPTVQRIEYKKIALNNLVTMIPVWGNRLTDEKFKNLYKLLSQTGFVKFYGVDRNEKIIQDGYMGEIPFDGSSVIDILQKHGIVLILHSDIHNLAGVPSSRIFEAAAASTVVISDENSFVKEHFADTVFYIDTSLPAVQIYQQIQAHMNTIRLNPENALAMAEKAHRIFTDKFLMTEQLLKLETLHNKIKSQKLLK